MKAFVITLLDNPSSVNLSSNCIKSLIENEYDSQIFGAHCGTESIDYLSQYQVFPISDSSIPHYALYAKWTSVLGTIGCFASHFNLWLKCTELNEPIIIMEHDAIILKRWENPEWKDVLHLDWEGSIRRRGMRNGFDHYAPVVENSVFRMGFEPGEASGVISMNCNYAYAIKPTAAIKLIEDAKSNGWFAADRFIREPLVNIETIHPKVAEEQPQAIEMFTTSF